MTFRVGTGTPRYYYGQPAWGPNDVHETVTPPTLRIDDMGPSWTFVGGDSYVHSNASDTPSVIPLNAQHVTLTAWVRPASLGNYRGIIATRGSDDVCMLLSGAGGNPLGYLWQNTGTDFDVASGLTLTVDRWHFCSVSIWPAAALLTTWDHVNGLRTYRDAHTHAAKTTDSTLSIGRDPSASALIGSITDARIYDRALEVDELLAMATSARWDLYAQTRPFWMDAVEAAAGGGRRFVLTRL